MNVYAIGSCRIHNPLKKTGILVNENADCLNGLCHTTKEIIQKFVYSQGNLILPKSLFSLIDTRNYASVKFDKIDLSFPDIYYLEISSRKELRYMKYYLQLNCVHKFMNDNGLQAWCESESCDGVDLKMVSNPVAKDVACNVKISLVEIESLVEDVKYIVNFLRKPIVIVGHVVHKSFAEKLTGYRYVLNSMLKVAAKQAGVHYFDVGRLVDFYGRDLSLLDCNHWRPEIEQIVGMHYLEVAESVLSGRPGTYPWLFSPN